jgi:hypothetical protein
LVQRKIVVLCQFSISLTLSFRSYLHNFYILLHFCIIILTLNLKITFNQEVHTHILPPHILPVLGFELSYFLDRALSFCLRLASYHDPPTYALKVAWITGSSHHSQLVGWCWVWGTMSLPPKKIKTLRKTLKQNSHLPQRRPHSFSFMFLNNNLILLFLDLWILDINLW